MRPMIPMLALALIAFVALPLRAVPPPVEVSDDGQETVTIVSSSTDGQVITTRDGVPYGTAPDWENALRRQVGGLQVADMNGDGWADVVVGCYISNSFPPYTDWENLIYYNTGGALEADPSWVSADEVSTGDIEVADIDGDGYPDIFSANGGSAMSPSVIYWGTATGPSTSPGWSSAESGGAWNNYALPYDIDHDGDIDVITANQGNSPTDPYRPMYIFFNDNGTLSSTPGWQSAEMSLQNYLAVADWDHDGWDDIAVSKWANFASGIYRTVSGVVQTVPTWTTGTTDTDKGVAWGDVDGDGWADLALGHSPTQLWGNDAGALSVVWASSATYFGHSDITFCDVDRDGDLDLAEDHFSNGQVHIYLNQNGTLSTAPSWTYDSPSVGTAIAFGDINGDDWPDLVVGNSGEPCVKVFLAHPDLTATPDAATPPAVTLHGAYPNPFNPRTTVAFTLAESGQVDLAVYDPAGRRLRTLAQGPYPAGRHAVTWDGLDDTQRAVAAGTYLCRVVAGQVSQTRTVTLVR